MQKPQLSFWQICNMSIGFFGIQFGWGLQMANMSAIYEYLGAKPDNIPILWLAAPLTGLFVQPLIGHLSDSTWCKLGRRRPYFLFGSILATMALFLMPYSGTLIMAASLLWIMDASVNISMEPFRAFVADLLPEDQRTVGFTMQGVFIGLGAVTASALPWLLQNVFGIKNASKAMPHVAVHHMYRSVFSLQDVIPRIVRISFHIGAVAFIVTVLWTVFTTKEYPPDDMDAFRAKKKKNKGFFSMLKIIYEDFVKMPKTMRELAWVQIFTWMGFFCMWIYFPVTVANNVFGAKEGTSEYLSGLEWAGLCFAMYNGVCFVFSLFLPRFARKLTRKFTHFYCLLAGAGALVTIFFVHNKYLLMLNMLFVGMTWASVLSMPYAMLSSAVPREKMGIYMGIFNFFITIPQIIISLGFGWVMLHLLHNNRVLGVVTGGLCWIIAALLTLRVKEHSV